MQAQLQLLLDQGLPRVRNAAQQLCDFLRHQVLPLVRLGYLRTDALLRWLVSGVHAFVHARGVQDLVRWLAGLAVIKREMRYYGSRLTCAWECTLLHGRIRCDRRLSPTKLHCKLLYLP